MLRQWLCGDNTRVQNVLEEVCCSEGAVDLETPIKISKVLKFHLNKISRIKKKWLYPAEQYILS